MGVSQARLAAADGDEVSVVGLVGGADDPFVDGMAAFTITDFTITDFTITDPASGDHHDHGHDARSGCGDPNCSSEGHASQACRVMVKLVDRSGRIVATDARELLGIRKREKVVVHGYAKCDDFGNLTILADGVQTLSVD